MVMSQFNPPPLPTPSDAPSISIDSLTYKYPSSQVPVLTDLTFELPPQSLTLLIGSNGSGKSTLMRILAGRFLTEDDSKVRVLGMPAFRSNILNFHRTHVDVDWGTSKSGGFSSATPLTADVRVGDMMAKQQEQFLGRRDELVELLGINLDWRMYCLSDGQRRRVQLMLNLLRPFKLLLLDEVTTSLDVCVRQDLLRYLTKEVDAAKAEGRQCCIVYATHIFDGLDDWASHLIHLTDLGHCAFFGTVEQCGYYQELKQGVDGGKVHPALTGGRMLAVAEKWLRAELDLRKRQLKEGQADPEEHEYSNTADLMEAKQDPTARQGGYASGRGIPMEVLLRNQHGQKEIITGKDKLCGLKGNAGVVLKHR